MIKMVRDLSINRKLLLIILFSSFASFVFACLFLLVLEITEFQKNLQDDLSLMAEGIANRSTAALLFDDKALADENLAILNNLPTVQSACLYDGKDTVFAQLLKNTDAKSTCPLSIEELTTRLQGIELWVVQPIVVDAEKMGTIYIHADLSHEYWRKIRFITLLFLVLLAASVLTFFTSKPLLKLISSPIKKLVDTVKEISATQDYSLRAVKVNNDDLGILVDAFNGLIHKVSLQNQDLIRAKDRYMALYNHNPAMIFNLARDGRILSVNHTGAQQLGLKTQNVQGQSIFDFVYCDDLPLMHHFIENCLLKPSHAHKQEIRKVCSSGKVIWLKETARLVEHDNQVNSILLACEDVTEARLLNERITYQASHDDLTGLANRSAFDRFIKQTVQLAQREGSEHALCYLDLDQFKVVNDTCGHLAGDELLRQLSDLLRKHIRRQDLIARLGGDEFGIVMNDCSLDHAFKACESLRNVISGFQFAWEEKSFGIGVSIGISSINNTTGNAVELLKDADAACYAAKDRGRNRVHVFRPDDQQLAQRQGEMQWVGKIQRALEQNHFFLFGQLIAPLADHDNGLHFETLVRYQDESGLIIPPGAFLPAAERYNLAPSLDRWVISTLFEWIALKPGFLDQLSVCSINLSGLSMSDELMLEFISAEFTKWSIPTHKICFEITETAAIGNLSYATQFINHLREQGCLFSLDDFGSGLSSFAYLKNLPVDFLKIDGLFVKDILDDKVDLAMVRSINDIGHVLDKKTIAEFVENTEILNLLHTLGVDYAQGYAIGKPVPLDELKLPPFFNVTP